MAPHLLSLPTECISEIASHLCLHCTLPFPRSVGTYKDDQAREGLKSLSESCRRLRAVAQPVLFHSLGAPNDANTFLRLITTRPELAALTRHLSFDPTWGSTNADSDPTRASIDADSLEQLGRDLHLLADDQGCPAREPGWHMATPTFAHQVLISMLPDLKSFATPIYGYADQVTAYSGPFMYSHLAQRTKLLSPEPALPSLRTLTIASGYVMGDRLDVSEIGPMSALLNAAPNLQRLRFAPCFGGDPHGLAGLSDVALQKLQVIDLLHFPTTAVDGEDLYTEMRAFARLCPRLREVNLYTQTYGNSDVTHQGFSPAQVLKSLKPAAASLRRIDIDASDSPVLPDHESLGPALAELVNLESLSLDEQCFCHHRFEEPGLRREDGDASCITGMLPQTVRHLSVKLARDTRVIGDIVQLGAQVASGGFANLERVDVVIGKYVCYAVDLSDRQRDAVLGAFRGTNVRVYIRRVVHDDPSKHG